MQKKLLHVLLVVVVLISILLIGNSVSINAENHYNERKFSILNPVSIINTGDDTCDVWYYYSEMGFNEGPNDYIVNSDESVVILDTVGSKILFCKNNYVFKTVLLDSTEKWLEIEKNDDGLYYVESESGLVIKINENYEICRVEETLQNDFFYESGVDSEQIKQLLELVKKEDVDIYFVGIDKYGNFYTEEYKNISNSSFIILENSIHKYDKTGKEIGYAIYNTEDNVSYPRKPIKIDENGNIYIMLCEQGYVGIYNVKLGTDDESTLLKKAIEYDKKIESEYAVYSNTRTSNSNSLVSLTRYQVFLRAYQMERLNWSVSADNKDISSLTNVSLPRYVANAQVGERVSGIPYCWGGFNGYETIGSSNAKMRFADVCKKDIVTGNVTTAGNYKSGTAGLDCSGFVASAYGSFTTKPNTSALANYGTAISYDQLQSMDFMVKSGSHAVLFASITEVDGVEMFNIYDASIDTGKVAYRTVKKSYLSGYQARTVWSE